MHPVTRHLLDLCRPGVFRSRLSFRLLALLACGLCLALTGTCRKEPAPRRVIFILLDAARPDRFSCYGYERLTTPNIDALAESGAVFLNHFSQGTATRDSLPTFFYSRYFSPPLFPLSRSVPLQSPESLFRTIDAEATSLPRALSGAGLKTAMISAHTWINAGSLMAEEFDEFHELAATLDYPEKYAKPRAEQVIDYVLEWLERHRNEDYFLYLHLMDTHFPHFLEEDGLSLLPEGAAIQGAAQRFQGDGRPKRSEFPLSEDERLYLDTLYDGSLKYADRQLGRLFDYLRDTGDFDDTMILITSDHGEHLMEVPGRLEHGGPAYDLVSRVPLILSYPRTLAAAKVEALTEGVDLLPTVLAILGIEMPPGKRADGVDLTSVIRGEVPPKPHVFLYYGIRGRRDKYLFTTELKQMLATEELPLADVEGALYDLQADPLETTDLSSQRPELVAELVSTYRRSMLRPYWRFRTAKTLEQPEEPFAIPSSTFELQPEVTTLFDILPSEMLAVLSAHGGWVRFQHWHRFALAAGDGAASMVVRFPLPSGQYRLTAAIQGAANLSLPGSPSPVEIRSELLNGELTFDSLLDTEEIDCGTVTVRGNLFSATIVPHLSESTFMIRYFGFEPLIEGAPPPDVEDDEIRERLRTLGYIN